MPFCSPVPDTTLSGGTAAATTPPVTVPSGSFVAAGGSFEAYMETIT